ncbi:MAG: hypothetical protein RLZZ210_988 [Pseudomonadota bacterium]|jgi:cell division protein FtsQ
MIDNHIDDISTTKSGWFYNAKLMRSISSILVLITFIYSLVWLGLYVVKLPYFAINNFNIYTNGIDINLNIIQEQLGKSRYSFFSPSLNDIRTVFEDLPSIKSANIVRKYPNSVDVILEKQKPFARWGTQDNLYMNADGLVYTGSTYDELRTSITLYGQDSDSELVLKQYHEFQRMLKYKILSLTYTTERNWLVILSNSQSNLNNQENQIIKITLGKEDNNALAKKISFWQKNWNLLKQKPEYANVNVFDLRYKGFTMKTDNNLSANHIANNSKKSNELEVEQMPEEIHEDEEKPSGKDN